MSSRLSIKLEAFKENFDELVERLESEDVINHLSSNTLAEERVNERIQALNNELSKFDDLADSIEEDIENEDRDNDDQDNEDE